MKKTIRTATLGIAEEYRKMEVGDVTRFPLPQYNYNSIRSTPSSTLMNDRLDGKEWKVKLNLPEKYVEVTRTA